MTPLIRSALAVALLVLPSLSPAQTLLGRSDSVYTWRGALWAGSLLTIRNFNGPVDVRPSDGATAEVRAEKRTSRGGGSISDVAFEVKTGSSGDVTICATFRDNNPCDDRRYRDSDDDYGRRRYVTVAMTILLPRGAQLKVSTGNGAVSIERAAGDVSAATGNGRVRVEGTGGTVRVTTGNGDVDDVTMTELRANEDMSFSTGSGGVRVTLPAGYNGELDATTGNGELRSDFELKVQGRLNPRHIRATIGEGGSRLRLTTGNGRLEVRKGT
jgi:DUF4097 and DUF4098 domain-containing protein YvlB